MNDPGPGAPAAPPGPPSPPSAHEPAADVITHRERLFFDAYGFLSLPGLLAPIIDDVSAEFDAIVADPDVPRIDVEIPGHHFEPWTIIGIFSERHPALDLLPLHPRILAVAHGLLGPGAVYVNSDVSVMRCVTEWHYDTPVSDVDRRHLKIGIYLDPLDHDTGALRFLPGIHNARDVYEGPLRPFLGYDGATERRTGIRGEDLPCWSVPNRPGDVLVWDYRTMHSSFGSTAPRRQIAVNFRGEPIEGSIVDGYELDLDLGLDLGLDPDA